MAQSETLIQIRERDFLDILDLALLTIRERPWAIALSALAGIVPCELLTRWLLDDSSTTFSWLFLVLLEAPLATAPLTIVLGGLMFGEPPSARRVLRVLRRGLLRLLFVQVILRGMLIMVVILSPLIPLRLAFMSEIILLEGEQRRGLFARSALLCGERSGDLFGRALVQLLFATLFVGCFWYGANQATKILFDEWTWVEPPWRKSPGLDLTVAVWIAVSFFTVVRFLTYIDQRIRLEGWEIELRLKSAGARLEEASRW